MTTLKKHLISAGITFVATFILVVSLAVADSNFTWSKQAFSAVIVAGVISATRALAKIAYELTSEYLSSK